MLVITLGKKKKGVPKKWKASSPVINFPKKRGSAMDDAQINISNFQETKETSLRMFSYKNLISGLF